MKQSYAVGKFSLTEAYKNFPAIPVLFIHGAEDQIVAFSEGQGVLTQIPRVRSVEIGDKPGQIPNDKFGHHWWEYFDVKVWRDVIEEFAKEGANTGERARL